MIPRYLYCRPEVADLVLRITGYCYVESDGVGETMVENGLLFLVYEKMN